VEERETGPGVGEVREEGESRAGEGEDVALPPAPAPLTVLGESEALGEEERDLEDSVVREGEGVICGVSEGGTGEGEVVSV